MAVALAVTRHPRTDACSRRYRTRSYFGYATRRRLASKAHAEKAGWFDPPVRLPAPRFRWGVPFLLFQSQDGISFPPSPIIPTMAYNAGSDTA